jgi:HlyD family secretion protein
LASLSPGGLVRIRIDEAIADSRTKGHQEFIPGIIIWISEEAEFSPKNIQTRESRNELVFKIRASVPNREGLLKAGLPVEVWR